MWQLRTLADAYQERPPTRYIVDKFFSAGSLNIVYGAPASMKSMILADMCAAVVSGSPWLPNCFGNGVGVEVEKAPVLWIDMDNGTRRTDERIDAVSKARHLPVDAPFFYVSMPMPPLQLHSGYTYTTIEEDGTERVLTVVDVVMLVIDHIRECGAEIVVIDNLGLITGDVEENSAEMASVMNLLRMVAERTDAAIIVIHHQRKGGASGGRAGDSLRGHSSIEAAVDLALQVQRESDDPKILLRSTKTRGVDVPQIFGRFNYEHVPESSDLARAWFDGVPGVRGENAVRDAITAVLEAEGSSTKTRLAQMVQERLDNVGINKIRAWIDELLSVGELVEIEAKGNKKRIELP